jgi:hypothetical protein
MAEDEGVIASLRTRARWRRALRAPVTYLGFRRLGLPRRSAAAFAWQTVRALLLVAVASTLLAQAPPPEAYPGQRGHGAPPEGWYCAPPPLGKKAHACACKRTCTVGADGKHTVVEDEKCAVWCHPDHCTCATGCHDTEHH